MYRVVGYSVLFSLFSGLFWLHTERSEARPRGPVEISICNMDSDGARRLSACQDLLAMSQEETDQGDIDPLLLHYNISDALSQTADYDAALEHLKQQENHLKGQPHFNVARSTALIGMGAFEDAIKEAQFVLNTWPNLPSALHDKALLNIAKSYRGLGKGKQELSALSAYLVQAPQDQEQQAKRDALFQKLEGQMSVDDRLLSKLESLNQQISANPQDWRPIAARADLFGRLAMNVLAQKERVRALEMRLRYGDEGKSLTDEYRAKIQSQHIVLKAQLSAVREAVMQVSGGFANDKPALTRRAKAHWLLGNTKAALADVRRLSALKMLDDHCEEKYRKYKRLNDIIEMSDLAKS